LDEQVLTKHKRDDIRAIIISGEASATGVANLGAIAVEEVGTDQVKLMTDIDPLEVVAHGAAVWARITHEQAEDFLVPDGNKIADDEILREHEAERRRHEHDEL
jgi:NAD(P)H-hydrate repair Nnr-like enzyme with NAD(P)H-hydrate dehydratase domain